MATRFLFRTCQLHSHLKRTSAKLCQGAVRGQAGFAVTRRLLTTVAAGEPRSTVRDNIWSSPYPDVELPEVDLARYMLDFLGRYGDREALRDVATGKTLTYAQIQTQITRAASALSKMGLRQGDTVTLLLPNCLEYIVIYLAVTALGAIASPTNPMSTTGELRHALNLAESKMLVTVPNLLDVARIVMKEIPSLKNLICTEPAEGCRHMASLLEDDGSAFPEHLDISHRDQMASLPFSSGTTGLPKGVMLSHFNLVANLQQMRSPMVATYEEGDCIASVLPFYHIYGLNFILLLSLTHGIRMAVMSKFDPEQYLKAIQDIRCTHLYAVPPIILFLAQHPMVDKYDLSSVRRLTSAAAPVSVDMCAKVLERLKRPDIVIRQGFGMTETSPVTHCNSETNVKLASVGQVIPNTFAKIIDVATGEALGPNQPGEMCMKGPQIMMGYIKNEKATADTIDKDGWIHSGDIAYVDEDGFFTITDRMKELIKYKGNQVPPAELESVLVDHPKIIDAAVIGIPDERAGELPRAYVVLKPGMTMTEEEVAQHVKDNVASYKQLFGGVEIRSEVPKSPSGKILRRVLKDEYLEKH